MKRNSPAKDAAVLGLLFALAIVLSYLEGLLPSLLVPGVKLGLSNVVVMYCVFLLGARKAWLLTVLKALFVLLTRGLAGAALSACGGLLSLGVMCLLTRRRDYSVPLVSIAGAVAHNVGQLLCAAFLLRLGQVLFYYLLLLVPAGVLMGAVTALLLRTLLPLLQKLDLHK